MPSSFMRVQMRSNRVARQLISHPQGVAVFAGGNALQNQAHRILAALAAAASASSNGSNSRTEIYSIPRGVFEALTPAHTSFETRFPLLSHRADAELVLTAAWLAGGAFEWVSCPHYLGEVVIYIGLLLMLRGRHLNAWLMLAWVVRPHILLLQAD